MQKKNKKNPDSQQEIQEKEEKYIWDYWKKKWLVYQKN